MVPPASRRDERRQAGREESEERERERERERGENEEKVYMEFEVMVDVAVAANASIPLGVVVGVLGNDMIAVWNGHALPAVLAEVFASRSRTTDGAAPCVR